MNAYAEEMARISYEERSAREAVTFELPARGPVSWQAIERCANEAGMSIEDWVGDAIANHVRWHDSQTRARQYEAFGKPEEEHKPMPKWKGDLAEMLYRLAEKVETL